MRNVNQDNITQAVLSRFSDTPDPRSREILISLVQHLHAFARDVQLTESELMQGVNFLTSTGQKCSGTRQEFILLSDVLGLSMLTVAMNNDKPDGCTESTVFGPFYVSQAPRFADGMDISNGAKGASCEVVGLVRALGGNPIADATIEVWQADDEGMYDVQKEGLFKPQARGVLTSQSTGEFRFKTVVPEPYPIPTDGPVGALLRASERHPWRPAHLHFMISAPGFQTLVTHLFRGNDPYLDSDAVFGVRQSLIADWDKQEDGVTRLVHEFVLNPEEAA